MTTESQQNINTQNDEISLKDLILKIREWWRYLLSKWIVILIFGLIGGALGFAYAYFKKPIYTATTTFVLEDEKSGGGGLGNLAGLASMAGVDLGGGGGGIFQGDNILGLYKSRTMLEQTLMSSVELHGSKQLLVEHYIEFNELRKKWQDKPELAQLQFKPDTVSDGLLLLKPLRLRDSVLGIIVDELNKNYLTVTKPDKKLSTIQVDVKAKDELFAKAFNDALVKNVSEFYITTKTKKTLQNVKILQHKTDSVRAVMNGAIFRAVAVVDATPNLNPTRQVQRVAPAQQAQFSAETNKAVLSEMVKNLELSKMGLLKETPLIQIIDQPVLPLEKQYLTKILGVLSGFFLAIFLTSLLLIMKRFFEKITN